MATNWQYDSKRQQGSSTTIFDDSVTTFDSQTVPFGAIAQPTVWTMQNKTS